MAKDFFMHFALTRTALTLRPAGHKPCVLSQHSLEGVPPEVAACVERPPSDDNMHVLSATFICAKHTHMCLGLGRRQLSWWHQKDILHDCLLALKAVLPSLG